MRSKGLRRALLSSVIACCVFPTFLGAQSAERPLTLNGFGGFGYDYTNLQTGNVQESYHSLTTELGLAAGGYVYDPRLLDYSFSGFWDGDNTSVEQGSARTNGLTFNGNLSFLPERAYPFSIYFTRTRSTTDGSLIPPYVSTDTIVGLRGEIKKPQLAMISYNFGYGDLSDDVSQEENVPQAINYHYRQTFGEVNATRKLAGWDVRLFDNYLRLSNNVNSVKNWTNTLNLFATRNFADKVQANFDVERTSFEYSDTTPTDAETSSATLAAAGVTWKNTKRLTTTYQLSYSNNAINTLALATSVTGEPDINLPFNALTENSNSLTLNTSANFRATEHLAFNGNFSYDHNGLDQQSVASLTASQAALVTTGGETVGGGYSYYKNFGNLKFNSMANVNWLDYAVLEGSGSSGIGYSLMDSLSGGNVHKARWTVGGTYDDTTNPFFFNIVNSINRRANLRLDSQYFRWVTLQAIADLGKTSISLGGSAIHLDNSNYSVTASTKRAGLFASRGITNSAQQYYSLITQSGSSTGGTLLPPELLNPFVYSYVQTEQAGLLWHVNQNLLVQSRISENRYLFTFTNSTLNTYRQLDLTAEYKLGRFTILAGYGHATSEASMFNELVDRFYIRLRFPFHVL